MYKIFQLKDNNTIENIIVFHGKTTTDMNLLFRENKNYKTFQHIFEKREWELINSMNISVFFTEQEIHLDDTIGDIKLKILNAYDKMTELTFSFHEIYLFSEVKKKLLNLTIYDKLSNHKKEIITKYHYHQFIDNIVLNHEGNKVQFELEDKPIYEYEDIISLNIDNQIFYVNTELGNKSIIRNKESYSVVNPFIVSEYDVSVEDIRNVNVFNSEILMNMGEILHNRIYLCLAQDVLNHNPDKYTSKIYFPYLYSLNIFNITTLIEQRKENNWISDNIKLIETNELNYEKVDFMYDHYKGEIPRQIGIQTIYFTIKSDYEIKIPLDIIFKLLESTEINPFIKLNQEKRENIYRLYTNKISVDGVKLPMLSNANINKLIQYGKKESVTVYINREMTLCEFFENGDIIKSRGNYIEGGYKMTEIIHREKIETKTNELY